MVILNQAYTYENLIMEWKSLCRAYPEILKYEEIGCSHDGREIPMIRMGMGQTGLICSAGIHGRESINPVLLLQMAQEYADAWQKKRLLRNYYDVQNILDHYSIFWVPLLNPDGYEIATRGFCAIRNPRLRNAQKIRRIPWENWKYNARGIDINRNFPSKTYVSAFGEPPASENETLALMHVFRSCPSIGYLDFHSRGRVIYYYRNCMPEGYNRYSRKLADTLTKLSDYRMGEKEEEFSDHHDGGNSVHYYSEKMQKPAITVETLEEEADFPLDVQYQTRTFKEIWLLPLQMLQFYLE